MHAIKHTFSAECCCQSPGEDVTRKEFTAFLDMKKCKNCTHKISPWEHLTLWRPVRPVSWEHSVPHFCSPPWAPLRGGWRSAGARRASFLLSTLNTSQGRSTAAHNLILVEADGVHQGKYQFVIDNAQHFIPSSRVQSLPHTPPASPVATSAQRSEKQ